MGRIKSRSGNGRWIAKETDDEQSTSRGRPSRQRNIDDTNDIDETRVQRVARNLEFTNPGKKVAAFMESLLHAPRPRREAAKKAEQKIQKVASTGQESKYRHNAKGDMIITNTIQMPLCDCLKPGCDGCFWPCYECGGRRCSTICQKHRPFVVAHTAQSGGGIKDKTRVTNPFLPHEYYASKKK